MGKAHDEQPDVERLHRFFDELPRFPENPRSVRDTTLNDSPPTKFPFGSRHNQGASFMHPSARRVHEV